MKANKELPFRFMAHSLKASSLPRSATTSPVSYTHLDVYKRQVVDGVVHYCVTNMPGAVPHTSTLALTNSTFPYVLRIANQGAREAIRQDAGLAEGLNTWLGAITYRGVAESQQRAWTAAASLLG